MKPFFSILIPSYNRPEYLPRAIRSILSNTSTDFELLVSDDASPRKEEIQRSVEPFLTDPRFRYVQQETNLREAKNRGFLTDNAQGEYLIILADDDLLSSHALGTLRRNIDAHPGFSLYLFGYSVIDEHDNIIEERRALRELEISLDCQAAAKDLLCSDFQPFWLYHPATFCFPASLRNSVVPNHSVGIGDDVMFLIDVMLSGNKSLIIPEVLFSYRKFGQQSTYSQTNQSGASLANVITRRHILYNLLARKDLQGWVGDFVQSYEYRRRFLYDAAACDPAMNEESISTLDLTPEHRRELSQFWQKRGHPWYRRYLLLGRMLKYIRHFGYAACLESFKVIMQRRHHRTLSV